jgi:hypothetical protein
MKLDVNPFLSLGTATFSRRATTVIGAEAVPSFSAGLKK